MSRLDFLKRKKRLYENSYKNAKKTVETIEDTLKLLSELQELDKSFLKNDEIPASGNTINDVIEKEENTKNNIIDNILPEIKRKIHMLNEKIDEEIANQIG